jgi:hypothetical protein
LCEIIGYEINGISVRRWREEIIWGKAVNSSKSRVIVG